MALIKSSNSSIWPLPWNLRISILNLDSYLLSSVDSILYQCLKNGLAKFSFDLPLRFNVRWYLASNFAVWEANVLILAVMQAMAS